MNIKKIDATLDLSSVSDGPLSFIDFTHSNTAGSGLFNAFCEKKRNNAEVENNHESHGQPEIALLKAVILQGIIDMVNNSKRTEDKVAKNDATDWFDVKNKDFQFVCDLIGWNPSWVLETTKNAVADPGRWRRNQGRY